MGKNTKETLRNFGLTHLVAVSGFQVVLLTAILEKLFLSIKIRFRSRFILLFLSIFLMAIFTGLQAPIIRAFLSAVILLFAKLVGRRCTQLRALFFSGGLMLIINPLYIFSISFQLSFVATFALIQTKFKYNFANFIAAPINAFLYTLPIIVGLTNSISPVGILTNILVAPFVSWITYLSLLSFIPVIGELFLIIVNTVLVLFLNTISELSSFIMVLEMKPFTLNEYIVYYLILFLFNIILQRSIKKEITEPQNNTLSSAYLS